MSADDARRLELARAAWRAAQTDESDADAAVRRLSRRMATRRPRDPARRVVGLGAALLAFGATVAFAASGGVQLPFSGKRSASERPVALGHLPAAGVIERRELGTLVGSSATAESSKTETEAEPEAETGGERPAAEPKTERVPRQPSAPVPPEAPAPVEPPPSAVPAEPLHEQPESVANDAPETAPQPERAPTWRDVGEALAAKDDARARRALDALGKAPDPVTRAKARLGLAQLAASRGDCPRARSLALEVASSPDADARTAARARALAARCR